MSNDLLDLPFDLYVRNFLMSFFVGKIRGKGPLKILDVGGKGGEMARFFEGDRILVVDILPGSETEGEYFRGTADKLPFADGAFDAVICSDVYEHIPPALREKSLREMLRVSASYLVIGAPFYSSQITNAEIIADRFFKEVTGTRNPWLREHLNNGLPLEGELESTIAGLGYSFIKTGSVNVTDWLLFQLLIAYSHRYQVQPEDFQVIYRYYNEHAWELYTDKEAAYRKTYLIGKAGTLPKTLDAPFADRFNPVLREELYSEVFGAIKNGVERLSAHAGTLNTILTEKEKYVQHLDGIIAQAKAEADGLSRENQMLTDRSSELSRQVEGLSKNVDSLVGKNAALKVEAIRLTEAYDAKISQLTGELSMIQKNMASMSEEIHSMNVQVDTLAAENSQLKARSAELSGQVEALKTYSASLEQDNFQMKNRLNSIQSSISWRVVSKVQNSIDRLAPGGSRRAIVYQRGLKGARILTTGGPGALLASYKQYSVQKKADESAKDCYEQWIEANEPDAKELARQKKLSKKLKLRPLISILTPVYNTPPAVLEKTIQSVLDQTYDHWELCIVDGNSTRPEVKEVLTAYASKDPRVKVKFLPVNDGISGNTNEALRMASGEYIALLDHDDLLAPFALYETASSINDDPSVDFIYSDKDMITEDGTKRFQPLFKPDWSPDMMFSANYLTHLCVIRKQIVDEIGGFLKITDGAQDWDIFLRVAEKTDRFHHIPQVLYHWRTIDTSVAKNGEKAKPYIFDAQRNTLEGHMRRQGLKGRAIFYPPGIWELKWDYPEKTWVTIIVRSENPEHCARCLRSIRERTTYEDYDVLVVPANKTGEALAPYRTMAAEDPRVRICEYSGPASHSRIYNVAVDHSQGSALLFLDERNTVVTQDWLQDMLGWAMISKVGAVGLKQVYSDNKIHCLGIVLGQGGSLLYPFQNTYEQHYGPYGYTEWYRDLLAVSGSCLLVRKAVFAELQGFDEAFSAFGWDIDFCIRVRQKGYRNVYTPFSKLEYPWGSEPSNGVDAGERQALYNRYKPLFDGGDPYYNQNLSLQLTTPTVKAGDLSTKKKLAR